MVKYLLDSNVLSEPAKPKPNAGVMRSLAQHKGEVATSSLVLHEMFFGMLRLPPSKRRDGLSEYLEEVVAAMPVLPYDADAARWHARERARLYRRTPPIVDAQIAAVAAVNGLILVTANVGDFDFFEGLNIENWMK